MGFMSPEKPTNTLFSKQIQKGLCEMKKMTRLKQWLQSSSSIYKFEKAYLDN